MFENEKVFAYQLTEFSFNKNLISNRGPMVAELVAGEEVVYYDAVQKRSSTIETGKYIYINPGRTFYFKASEKETIMLVLFEIK